jgi:hypothetical protein
MIYGHQLVERQQRRVTNLRQVLGWRKADHRRPSAVLFAKGAVDLGESFLQPGRYGADRRTQECVRVFVKDDGVRAPSPFE